MSRLTSSVDPASEGFKKNVEANTALVEDLRARVAQASTTPPFETSARASDEAWRSRSSASRPLMWAAA